MSVREKAFTNLSRNDLASIYVVDVRIIKRWLADCEIKHNKRLTPKELLKFFAKTGIPNHELAFEINKYLKKLTEI